MLYSYIFLCEHFCIEKTEENVSNCCIVHRNNRDKNSSNASYDDQTVQHCRTRPRRKNSAKKHLHESIEGSVQATTKCNIIIYTVHYVLSVARLTHKKYDTIFAHKKKKVFSFSVNIPLVYGFNIKIEYPRIECFLELPKESFNNFVQKPFVRHWQIERGLWLERYRSLRA